MIKRQWRLSLHDFSVRNSWESLVSQLSQSLISRNRNHVYCYTLTGRLICYKFFGSCPKTGSVLIFRYSIPHGFRCEDNHPLCTDILVKFVEDHQRLPITHITRESFHVHGYSFMPTLEVYHNHMHLIDFSISVETVLYLFISICTSVSIRVSKKAFITINL